MLVEDDPVNIKLFQSLIISSKDCPLARELSFELTCAESLSQTIKLIRHQDFDIILLDLLLPDGNGLDSLVQIREILPKIPVIIQTGNEDETIIVRAFELGADGYLKKNNLDSSLLIYAIRSALEKRQYIAKLEALQQRKSQEQEFQSLEYLANLGKTSITARMFGSEPLRESVGDIFEELVEKYAQLLDLALEQRAYKVEHNISEQLRSLADKLGFLKASPRDVVDIHTRSLKLKNQNATLAKTQAYVEEGRLMLLELMGYLTSYYRKYYIGLSNINLTKNSPFD